jgi:hypothetical protein
MPPRALGRLCNAAWDYSWSVVVPTATLSVGAGVLLAEHACEGNENSLRGAPAYLDRDGLARFQGAACRDDDVFMASYPKCGTTWCHQILFCLLRMDERGEFASPLDEMVGASGQVYPDGVSATRADGRAGAAAQRAAVPPPVRRAIFPVDLAATATDELAPVFFGGWSVADLIAQPAPRLFSSHIKAANLPTSLASPGSQARLVLCTRCPKDALLSGYFFVEKLDCAKIPALRAWFRRREKQIGGSGGSLEPPGPLLTHLHTVHIAYSECLPTRLNLLAERTYFSQVPRRARGLLRAVHCGGGGKINRVDPDFGSTLTVSSRDSQSNCWVNRKIMGQPCEFQVVDVEGTDDDARFGCGGYFGWHQSLTAFGLLALPGTDRFHTVHYERLQADFDGEVRRLAVFLGLRLGEVKMEALRRRTAMGAELGVAPTVATARVGKVGEHLEYLTPAHWEELDRRAEAAGMAGQPRHLCKNPDLSLNATCSMHNS